MYQTLVLVPGQAGVFMEHDSKQEAMNVICNLKNAGAFHNGGAVIAIPLNYVDETEGRIHFYMDVDDVIESKRQEFIESVKKFVLDKKAKLQSQE